MQGRLEGGGGKRGNFSRAPILRNIFLDMLSITFCIHSISKKILNMEKTSKDLPNMNTFCDWLSVTIVISVYDTFFRNYISIVLLSVIVLTSQSQRLFL